MVDLTREMADLMTALGRAHGGPAQTGRGRALMFVAAYAGEGTSTVAREYARCEAAYAKKPVWLIDADLKRQTQMQAVTDAASRFGPPGALSQASPDGSAFFHLSPPGVARDGQAVPDARYLVARPFLDRRLWVTRLLSDKLPPGCRPKLFEQTTYWRSLRGHAQTIVVDAPAMERGTAALQLAPLMDGVILVVSEGDGDVQARLTLRNAIERAGGRLMGMVYNRARHVAKSAPGRFAAL
ncbi:transcriptional regulator [Asticcacaulis sp. EMRT-3]|uniref:transcriptional regulator n=1 Tax=Asticcacaulis sp. EMRT-3 TaxID=3040349 RepID=UPI0024AF3A5F|nr:transcriptional regulator [Asticcacaulis sp. EMRT-3]MDI7774072.1 transcriptional regulator [Asticcacaulis sp. EMRT-3]